jgi:hypothetical protein
MSRVTLLLLQAGAAIAFVAWLVLAVAAIIGPRGFKR